MIFRPLHTSHNQRGAAVLENAVILLLVAVIALPSLRLVGTLTGASYLQVNLEQDAATLPPASFFGTFTEGRPTRESNLGSPGDGIYALQGGGSETNNTTAGSEGEECRPSLNSPCSNIAGGMQGNRF